MTILACKYKDKTIREAEKLFKRPVALKLVKWDIFSLLNEQCREHPKNTLTSMKKLNDEQRLEENNPYSRLIRDSIDAALKVGASDVHYEPFDSGYIIRFRIHGILSDWKALESKYTEPITAKLKSIVNMDMAVIGRPQDSRAFFPKRSLDIRANSFPVVGSSEKIVLRFQRQKESFSLEKLGLQERPYNALLRGIQKQDGLILISGPTGSGKTTTLYSLLCKMDKYGKNISTLEDPVEKKLDRISQAQVGDYKDFSDFERALLRQDPDIILLGEIRDKKSAELCMRLAATGHLVLSTIHANGAYEVIERLKNLGIDDFSIKSHLRLSVAQRLVKKICPICSKPASDKLIADAIKNIKSFGIEKITPESSKTNHFKTVQKNGCQKCKNGIVGRMIVMEYLEKDDIKSLMENGVNTKTQNAPRLSRPSRGVLKNSLVGALST